MLIHTIVDKTDRLTYRQMTKDTDEDRKMKIDRPTKTDIRRQTGKHRQTKTVRPTETDR